MRVVLISYDTVIVYYFSIAWRFDLGHQEIPAHPVKTRAYLKK